MIAPPPLSSGTVHEMVALRRAGVATTLRTADGPLFAVGVASAILLASPRPAAFTARTRTRYVTLPVGTVRVAVVAVVTVSAKRDQVVPESVDVSIA